MNIFERAIRCKLRFPSTRGNLTAEDLFDLPLVGGPFSLDAIARNVSRQLKEESSESFVETTKTTKQTELELSLDILKHVIASKQAAAAAAATRAEKAEKRRKLVEALERKENEEIGSLSREDLLKQLADLDA